MNRRTYLGSLAALTGASSAMLGTGAFSTASVSRGVSIAVSSDDEALLGLKPATPDGPVQIENGALTIDTTTGTADGLNPDSVFTFGSWNKTGSGMEVTHPAFQIINQSTVEQDIEFSYEWDSVAVGNSELRWYFTWKLGGTVYTDEIVVSESEDQGTAFLTGIPAGVAIDIAFRVGSESIKDDLSGTITLRSTDPNAGSN
jgi:hypothetical protein